MSSLKSWHKWFFLMNSFMCQPLKIETSLQSKANIYPNESSPFFCLCIGFGHFHADLIARAGFGSQLAPCSICSFRTQRHNRRNMLTGVSYFTSQAPRVNSTLTSVLHRPARTEPLALTNLVITSASVQLLLKVMSTRGLATTSKVN